MDASSAQRHDEPPRRVIDRRLLVACVLAAVIVLVMLAVSIARTSMKLIQGRSIQHDATIGTLANQLTDLDVDVTAEAVEAVTIAERQTIAQSSIAYHMQLLDKAFLHQERLMTMLGHDPDVDAGSRAQFRELAALDDQITSTAQSMTDQSRKASAISSRLANTIRHTEHIDERMTASATRTQMGHARATHVHSRAHDHHAKGKQLVTNATTMKNQLDTVDDIASKRRKQLIRHKRRSHRLGRHRAVAHITLASTRMVLNATGSTWRYSGAQRVNGTPTLLFTQNDLMTAQNASALLRWVQTHAVDATPAAANDDAKSQSGNVFEIMHAGLWFVGARLMVSLKPNRGGGMVPPSYLVISRNDEFVHTFDVNSLNTSMDGWNVLNHILAVTSSSLFVLQVGAFAYLSAGDLVRVHVFMDDTQFQLDANGFTMFTMTFVGAGNSLQTPVNLNMDDVRAFDAQERATDGGGSESDDAADDDDASRLQQPTASVT